MHYSEYSIKYKIKNSILIKLLVIVFILLFSFSCLTSKRVAKADKEITLKKSEEVRVLLSESKKIKVDFDNETEIIDIIGRRSSIEKKSAVQFIISNNGIKSLLKEKEIFSKEFLIVPKSNTYLLFNGKKYKGYFKIISNSSSLMLINYVNIEDYLKGVILKEMPLGNDEDHIEALKAFSIIARTYAMKKN